MTHPLEVDPQELNEEPSVDPTNEEYSLVEQIMRTVKKFPKIEATDIRFKSKENQKYGFRQIVLTISYDHQKNAFYKYYKDRVGLGRELKIINRKEHKT